MVGPVVPQKDIDDWFDGSKGFVIPIYNDDSRSKSYTGISPFN